MDPVEHLPQTRTVVYGLRCGDTGIVGNADHCVTVLLEPGSHHASLGVESVALFHLQTR